MTPADFDIRKTTFTLGELIERLKAKTIIYNKKNLTIEEMSEVLENILLRMPLLNGFFVVHIGKSPLMLEFVLGDCILETLDSFFIKEEFGLADLKVCKELENKTISTLKRPLVRRILETHFECYEIPKRNEDVVGEIVNRYKKMAAHNN